MSLTPETENQKVLVSSAELSVANRHSLASLCLSCWKSAYFSTMTFPTERQKTISIGVPEEISPSFGLSIIKDIALLTVKTALHPIKAAYETVAAISNCLTSTVDPTHGKEELAQSNKPLQPNTSPSTANYIFAGLSNITTDHSISQSFSELENPKKAELDEINSNSPIRDRNKLLSFMIYGSTPRMGIATPISPNRIAEAITNGQITPLERERLNCLDTFSESF